MTTTNKLTDTQHAVLNTAAGHPEGLVDWFPDNVKGGARAKVLVGLFNRALITSDGQHYFIAAEGYDALGRARPAPVAVANDADIEANVAAVEATWAQPQTEKDGSGDPAPANQPEEEATAAAPKKRDNTKQAQVIAMLRRPDGATIAEIVEATGWQQHTVRGTIAGALKKKLGLDITSTKTGDSDRVYRID